MKTKFLPFLLFPLFVQAQFSFEKEQLDTGNCSVNIYSNGALFNDPFLSQAGFEVPKGTSIHTIYAGGLWLGGYNSASLKSHIAVNTYNDSVTDFFEGPIANNYDQDYDSRYANVWKISKDQIDNHVQNWQSTGYTMHQSIQDWPGNGDTTNGEPLMIAPYVDINGNTIYDPENGDYPCIKGDQAIFSVFNDIRYPHLRSFGTPLGVEIRLMAYAFNVASEINNTVFFEYEIINRSVDSYTDFKAAMWADFDLGNPFDDYVGCNPSKNLMYVYNGDSFDENPGFVQSYGQDPPALGIKFLNDSLASFISYQNGAGPTGDPFLSSEYHNYLNGKWKDASSITFGGQGYGGTIPVNYIFNGSPLDTSEWSEVSALNFPGDRRALGSVIPKTFEPGDTIELSLAFIYARSLGADYVQNVGYLDSIADMVQIFYDTSQSGCYTPPISQPTGLSNEISFEAIKVFPQPAVNFVRMNDTGGEAMEYTIFTLDGKIVNQGRVDDNTIDLTSIEGGLYILKLSSAANHWTGKLVVTK